MAPWILSDGTEISIGGEVAGETLNAMRLRLTFAALRTKGQYSSGFGAVPHEQPLDINVPYLLDFYLRRTLGAEVVSGPEVVYPVVESRPAPPDGCSY